MFLEHLARFWENEKRSLCRTFLWSFTSAMVMWLLTLLGISEYIIMTFEFCSAFMSMQEIVASSAASATDDVGVVPLEVWVNGTHGAQARQHPARIERRTGQQL